MSTRSAGKRAAKSASAPKVQRVCSKCGVSHSAPTWKKCTQLNRVLFPSTSPGDIDDTVVGDQTSTPNNAATGTVNTSLNAYGPLVTSTVVVPDVVSSEVSACVLPQPVMQLDVADKFDHLANDVSAINSKLGVIGNEVQPRYDVFAPSVACHILLPPGRNVPSLTTCCFRLPFLVILMIQKSVIRPPLQTTLPQVL